MAAGTTKKAVAPAPDPPTRDQLVTKAYGIATSRLRRRHPDEFNELRVVASQELGIDWQPPLSAERKAEQEMEALLERFPHLADRFRESPDEVAPIE